MVNRPAAFFSAFLIAAMFAAGFWAMTHLAPDTRVAIHFDQFGRPNGFAAPARAFIAIPLVGLVVWVLFALLPRIDPRGQNIARSARAYGTIWIAVFAGLCLIQGSLIARAFGASLPGNRLAMASLGILFAVIGNVMGKIRPNHLVGIRTPWTLADERVWDKTHRFGGRAFVMGGITLLAAAFLAPPATPTVVVLLGVTFVVAVVTTVKSYLLWRGREKL